MFSKLMIVFMSAFFSSSLVIYFIITQTLSMELFVFSEDQRPLQKLTSMFLHFLPFMVAYFFTVLYYNLILKDKDDSDSKKVK